MIEKNQTWELVERLANRKIIGVKWVYRAKHNADGSLNKLKARLIVKGFSQKYGLDYLESFAPMARLDTIRLLAPRACYSRIDSYLISLGFERSISKPTLYVKKKRVETQLIVSLYVDDLLVTGGDQEMLAEFKANMHQKFEMSDLGRMTYFLGIEAVSTPVATERNYQAKVTLSKLVNLSIGAWVLGYIKGTLSYGMMYVKIGSMEFFGYTDSDWDGSLDDMKSTSGYVFTLVQPSFVRARRRKISLLSQLLR
ncbi:hypothetical protein CXB51_019181 [Gossypium anomalum]|uniref:Reverse transcriptase Ty1/copia-type domain-containing protein n=1 Tax=Gossypium anomalum TaxID=47600 RepID=A0A8J5YHT4_9ROSI|nr:hypothetical protein CXB51_019181 [Gossypium anomalum]